MNKPAAIVTLTIAAGALAAQHIHNRKVRKHNALVADANEAIKVARFMQDIKAPAYMLNPAIERANFKTIIAQNF